MKIPVHPGDQIDHYHIVGIADQSGPTSVFRATDVLTNRAVAIKIPHPEMESDPVFMERFQREAEIGESLDHPGILKVFRDEHPSQSYIVTEWFEGQTLRSIIGGSKLSHDRAIRITLNVCSALEYIQNRGIVHRDLRPENILVDSEDHIKLVNFGVAAKVGARRITFTNLAQVVGVSEYISPEELNGKRDDARSDIYALGVILYEMLTGKTPFQGSSVYDRLLKHPVPPREVDSTISPQLQEVIYRALERDPKNRYPNAHNFAADLSDLSRVGVAARPELREWKKTTSPRKKILLFAAITLAPIVIFALLFYFARHP